MVRYTTPALCFELETTYDLNEASFIEVTFRNRTNKLVLTTLDDRFIIEDSNKLYVVLTQEETALFIQSKVFTQIRFRIHDIVLSTDIADFMMEKVLNEEVI